MSLFLAFRWGLKVASQTHTLNPYARCLQQDDPLSVISSTPQRLEQLIKSKSDEKLQANPSPQKWSVRDILCHLADTEVAFAYRLRQTVAEPHHIIQPYDQDAFAAEYTHRNSREALDAFSAIRRWNVLFIRSAVPHALTKPVTHPERGTMTFQTILETMGGHDLNHLSQITALLR
jgi:uncharacterized damage-inducible protein DinB